MAEELLTEAKNRFVLYPIKYDKIWKMFKTAESSFWTVEEVDLAKDVTDWEQKLNDNERYFIKNILAFFAASDGIVNENLAGRFYNDVMIPEAKAFYGFQIAMETIHCVSGDTMVLTDVGHVCIKDHVNHEINVWNGEEFSRVTFRFTGNSELYKVVLSNGMELTCTSDHKWYTSPGIYLEDERKDITLTKDLRIGHIINKYSLPITNPQDPDEFKNPYIHGLFCGDGTYCNGYPSLSILGDKVTMLSHLGIGDVCFDSDKVSMYLTDYINKPKFTVPINYSLTTKMRWLEGIADTSYVNVSQSQHCVATAIQISNKNLKFLKDIQMLLVTIGINPNIQRNMDEMFQCLSTHDVEVDVCYTLHISSNDVCKLSQLGFSPKRLKIHIRSDMKSDQFLIRVKAIEKLDGIHPTYCFNEPKKHSGVFNGILTGQSEMYSLMIDTFVKATQEKDQLFNAMQNVPSIKKKAEWALKWISDNDAPFAMRLIAFAIVEGVFFSGAFCSIFWLKERGLMPGLCTSNEFISRDEGLHTEFAVLLYSMISNRLEDKVVHDIFKEAVDIEVEFITESIPCNLLGMNANLMQEYIKFVADRLLTQLGYDKIFDAKNPFPFMDRINLEHKTNFFENRESNYSKAKVGQTNVYEFSIDEDF